MRTARTQQGVAEIAMQVAATGIERQGRAQGGHRVVVPAGPRQGDAKRVVGLHILRVRGH